jgi:enoyl-CoA hydratase
MKNNLLLFQLGILNRRFGVPLLDGGAVRLPHLIGLSRALDLIMTGRIVAAEEAFQIGLVNRLCKPGTGLEKSLKTFFSLNLTLTRCFKNHH